MQVHCGSGRSPGRGHGLVLTLQQSPFSQLYYMLSRKCLTQLLYFISTASSLWPTFLLQGWQIQQQRGCTQRKTSISLRKTYMKWKIHTSITAPSTVGSNPNNLWAAVTFQCHQIQPLHFGLGVVFFENMRWLS